MVHHQAYPGRASTAAVQRSDDGLAPRAHQVYVMTENKLAELTPF